MCILGMCHFETRIFSPKFSLQSIITLTNKIKKSAPEHHHFRVFAAPETIIFTAVYCGQPEREAFGQRPGVAAGQSVSQTRPTSQIHKPPISRSSPLQSPAFSRSSRSGAPVFHFAVAHTYQTVSRVPSPPPPPRHSRQLVLENRQLGEILYHDIKRP